MIHSGVYEGWVRHRRHDPVAHEFRYPLFMTYLDLDELPWVLDPFRGWSARQAGAGLVSPRGLHRPGRPAAG